jgi:hypothetical protein
MNDHVCVEGGKPQGAMEGLAWASPGEVVKVDGEARWGRVVLAWRCCGAVEVHFAVNAAHGRSTETFSVDKLTNPYSDYPNNMWPAKYLVPRAR